MAFISDNDLYMSSIAFLFFYLFVCVLLLVYCFVVVWVFFCLFCFFEMAS